MEHSHLYTKISSLPSDIKSEVNDKSGEREVVYLNLKNAPVWIQKVIFSR